MEIVLQWLDDLDDLCFSVALFWRSACRFGLALGFAAALVLTPVYGSDLRLYSTAALTVVAVSSVLAWLTAVLITVKRQPSRVASTA